MLHPEKELEDREEKELPRRPSRGKWITKV